MKLSFPSIVKLLPTWKGLSQCILCIGLFTFCSIAVSGQSDEFVHPITCEEAVYHVSDALLQHSKRKNQDAEMIIVLRAGTGESQKINSARLKRIKAFVAKFKPVINPVYASGEPVKGYGVIEILVDGVRIYRLPIRKNKNIDFTICSV